MTEDERYERGQEIVREVEREFAGRPMAEMVEEVRARVEKLVLTDGGSYCDYLMKPVEEERTPNPEPRTTASRAFPDHFYVKPTIVAEPEPVEEWETRQSMLKTSIAEAQTYKDQWERWFASRDRVSYPGQFCQCGHKWEEHMPACVHLIEGCGCEWFLKVPGGVVEGG